LTATQPPEPSKLSQAIHSWLGRDASPAVRRWRRVLKIALLIGLFAGLFWLVPIQDVFQSLLSADPFLLALGMALALLVIFLDAVQFKILIRRSEINLSVIKILVINLTTKFYLLFMPGDLVGGGMRVYKLYQHDIQALDSLAAVAFDRLLETFLLIFLGLGFWFAAGQQSLQFNAGVVSILLLGAIALWLIGSRLSLCLLDWLETGKHPALQRPGWQSLYRKLARGLSLIKAYARFPFWEMSLYLAIGILRQLIDILSFLILARAIGIDQLTFMQMGWIRSVVLLAALLPFAFAGGVGIREASLVGMFTLYAIGGNLAIALGLLLFARTLLYGLIGGVIEAIDALRMKRLKGTGASP